MTDNSYRDIVVGAGIAGLTAAAYLTRAGRKVLLVEQNRECGGLVNSFNRDGFRFDAGIRALEDAGIVHALVRDLELDLEFVKSPVSVGIEDHILRVRDMSSLEGYETLLMELFPESKGEIHHLLRVIRRVMKQMDVLYGIENPFFKNWKRDTSFYFKKVLPWFPRFLFTIGKINRMNQPVESYLEELITNPSLRDMIAQHFFKSTPAFFALSYFSLYLDYFYPRGGMGRLADALKDKIERGGGVVLTDTRIASVSAAESCVLDHRGNRYHYENLLWAADLKTLYRNTDTAGLPPRVIKKIHLRREELLSKKGGDSVFTLYLEVDEPLNSFREIAEGHFFYTPHRQGLGSVHREELQQLLSHDPPFTREQLFSWVDRLIRLNTYEISIPGLKDSSLVPPGKTGLVISFLTDHELFRKVKERGWYPELVSRIEEGLVRVLGETIYPMLKTRVMKSFSFSPLSIEKRIGSSEGAITGWSFEESVPVAHTIFGSLGTVKTPIPSIVKAGQWAYSPAGVPMSMLTAKLAVNRILRRDRGKE